MNEYLEETDERERERDEVNERKECAYVAL